MWNKYEFFRLKVNNPIKACQGIILYNLDMIVTDFQNNDERKFWKVICHFVKKKKHNKSTSCIPSLCSTFPTGANQ